MLAVRLNRKRLAVILEEEIYLYDISNMNLLYTIPTSPNPHGMSSVNFHRGPARDEQVPSHAVQVPLRVTRKGRSARSEVDIPGLPGKSIQVHLWDSRNAC